MKSLTATIILITATVAASAQTAPPPKDAPPSVLDRSIPWKTVMKTEDGKAFIYRCDVSPTINQTTGVVVPGVGCRDLTLADVAAHSLYTGTPGEKLDPDVSFSRSYLAHEIETSPPPTLDSAEAPIIKKLIGENYPAIVVGQAFPLLFPNDRPGKIR